MTPVDPYTCQCVVTPGYSLADAMTIGRPRPPPARCTERAALVVTEKSPGSDGQRGAMSLCAACFAKLERRDVDVESVLAWIGRRHAVTKAMQTLSPDLTDG